MVQFNFTYDLGVSLEQRIGFELAAMIWGSYLSDDVSINLHIGSSDSLGDDGNAVGGAVPIFHEQTYGVYQEYVEADITTSSDPDAPSADEQAFESMQEGNTVDLMIDGEVVDGNTDILLTSAQAKALGMDEALVLEDGSTWDRDLVDSNGLDGYIIINQGFDWNYDFAREQNAQGQTLDFLSMALHEIGHNLGFVSGMDGTLDTVQMLSGETRIEDFTALDLFRHTIDSTSVDNADGSVSDLSVGENSYFSIDGGQTNLADFSTGQNKYRGGDGYQASHWKRMREALGIMDPTLAYKERLSLSTLDLQAMDVLGWDVNYEAADIDLDMQALLLQAEQSVATDLGLDSSVLTESRGRGNGQTNLYQMGYSSWWQLFETQILEMGYSSWWQMFEMGYSSWWQQLENEGSMLEMGYSSWWQMFEEQVLEMGYSSYWQEFKGEMLEMGYSSWWQVFEMGYSTWWQKLETYFSKLEGADGIQSATLRDEQKGFDLETGTIENVDPDNPHLDIRFRLNADGQMVLENLDSTAEVVLLNSQDFASIDEGILDVLSLSNGQTEFVFDYSDVVLIKTADGNVFKLGRFLTNGTDGEVDFDYQFLAHIAENSDGSTTTSTEPTSGVVTGGNKDDILAGLSGRDLIDGGKGDDLIDGKLGDDIILGGEGNDMIYGFDGNDVIYGGDGNDLLSGENDNDKLYGEAGHDIIAGGQGNDILDGGEGKDLLKGDAGDDVLDGGDGNDDLAGGAGNDVLIGSEGADLLNGGAGDDALYGDSYGSASVSASHNLESIAQTAGITHEEETAFRMRVEAEDMRLINYGKEIQTSSSGGEGITTGGTGQARTTFSGPTGTYDITVGYYDENDGAAAMNVKVGGESVDSWQLNQNLGSSGAGSNSKVSRNIQEVTLKSGQIIELEGIRNGSEFARFDYIDIVSAGAGGTAAGESYNLVKPTTRLDTNPYRIEAEAMTLSGGYQVESNRQDFASGDAVIRVDSGSGTATTTFAGKSGKYNIFVSYLDESDGQSTAKLRINGVIQDGWQFSRNSDSAEYRLSGLDVVLNQGDVIELEGVANAGEQARIDYIDLLPILAVELDDEVDISNFEIESAPLSTVRVEAEAMGLTGDYKVENKDFASGSSYVKADDSFSGTTTFSGETGRYNVVLGYYDEEDTAQFSARHNGLSLGNWQLTADLDGSANEKSFVTRTLATDVFIVQGDTFELSALASGGDAANIDFLEFTAFDPDAPIRVEAEFMNASGEYSLQEYDFASSGRVLRSEKEEDDKALQTSTEFTGQAGVYDIVVGYYDGNKGIAQLSASLGGIQLDGWLADQNLGSEDVEQQTFTTRTIAGVTLNAGDVFELQSSRDDKDYGAIDYVEFVRQGTAAATASENDNQAIQLEIEDMQLTGKAKVKEDAFAYGGGYVNTDNDQTGFTASTLFMGEAGYYDVVVGYYDENDGSASLSVKLNEDTLDSWVLDQQLGNKDAGAQTFTTRTVASAVQLDKTDLLQITGLKESGDQAAVDYLKLVKVDAPTAAPAPTTPELTDNNDVLRGGTGNDKLFGGEGNDILYGEDEFDRGGNLVEGNNDILEGGSGDDVLYGNSGDDVLYGDSSNETITTIQTPQTLTFRQGINGYSGTVDTTVEGDAPQRDSSRTTLLETDADDPDQSLMRFEDIFGSQAGQIDTNAVINSAVLELDIFDADGSFAIYNMLQNWSDTDTWNSLNNGIQTNGIEASTTPVALANPTGNGTVTIDVTDSLKAWQADPTANYGWAFLSTGGDVEFYSAESSNGPRLIVDVDQNSSITSPTALAELPDGLVYNGSVYLLTEANMMWTDAQAYAEQLGGNLVTINDAAEDEWLKQTFGTTEALWTGFSDAETEGTWKWASGEEAEWVLNGTNTSGMYVNWSPGQPDNNDGTDTDQDYAVLSHIWLSEVDDWDDVDSSASLRGIIEIKMTASSELIEGDDHLEGGSGNDTLEGGLGADTLDGSDAIALGKLEIDTLLGGGGSDIFVLGNSTDSYYIGGGNSDYALIKDFDATADVLQLSGSAGNYQQQQQDGNLLLSNGTDLVAILENTNSLDLSAPSTAFV